MKTKLTLTIDQHTVQKAKVYVAKSSESLSSVIENFLRSLAGKNMRQSSVDASRGLLKGKYRSLSDKEIREEHYQQKHGI